MAHQGPRFARPSTSLRDPAERSSAGFYFLVQQLRNVAWACSLAWQIKRGAKWNTFSLLSSLLSC